MRAAPARTAWLLLVLAAFTGCAGDPGGSGEPTAAASTRPSDALGTMPERDAGDTDAGEQPVGSTPDEADDPYGAGTETTTVHVMDLGSGRVQRLQELPDSSAAASSPDGSQLAFVGRAGRIRVNDRATGATSTLAPRSATGDELAVTDVRWSPDGRVLLAMAYTRARGYALLSVPVDGSSSEVRTPWTWALDWVALEDADWSNP